MTVWTKNFKIIRIICSAVVSFYYMVDLKNSSVIKSTLFAFTPSYSYQFFSQSPEGYISAFFSRSAYFTISRTF